jgi:hypothetical protein
LRRRHEDADGERILNFAEAQRTARGRGRPVAEGYVVANAADDYLRFLAERRSLNGRHPARPVIGLEALVRPRLTDVKLATLTTDQLRRWAR